MGFYTLGAFFMSWLVGGHRGAPGALGRPETGDSGDLGVMAGSR
jgi:hypothetical protein